MSEPDPARICYLELPAPDPAAAARFYEAVFAWRCRPSDMSSAPYWIFCAGDLEGGLDPSLPVGDGGALVYLQVEDIDAALAAVVTHGGAVARPRSPLGDLGSSARFRDPAGNLLGLYSRR